jgi:3-deoxy-D-manno-octulosonate 8-phosphate phosphatase (KDO 8-P phosphatase)
VSDPHQEGLPPGSSPVTKPSSPGQAPAVRPTPESVVHDLIERTPGVKEASAPEVQPEPLVMAPVDGPVRILFMDVDGTLTDGLILEHHDGDSRNFWVRDGLALQWARDLGVVPVAISGRASRAVEHRMKDLAIECHVGIQDKVAVAERILEREGARWAQCVMVGDDLPDVPMMKRVGWPIAVADAQEEVRAIARTITGAGGGHGAVREVVEMILRHNGTWDQVLSRYEVA